MTSRRKRKRSAQAHGLTEAELDLCELLGEVLEALRWNQILGYSNQYLLHERLEVDPDTRNRVMRAAAAAVEQNGRLQDWGRRLLDIQQALRAMHERMQGGEATSRRNGLPEDGREAADDG
ncbi:MAG: hypothetical protein IPK26_06890 [Planctomycetes bacterium]|nr:hypothetical protein [Planctomycetota bacterium]